MKQLYLLALLLLIPAASAQLQIDGISTDPAVLAAGDSVDVIVEYSTGAYNDRLGDPDWAFSVGLESGDVQTSSYVRITDPHGVSKHTTLAAGATKTKVFRIHVSESAPSGTYAFKLVGNWAYKGVAEQAVLTQRFDLQVKREAIQLAVADVSSEPKRLLPGTREAALRISVANSGAKDAHQTSALVELPPGMTPSFASGNSVFLASVPAGSTQQATLYVDVDASIASGFYDLPATFTFKDDSQNRYEQTTTARVFVSDKPRLAVSARPVAASSAQEAVIELLVTNTGDLAAEAIDARLLKESNQPFTLQTRSGYIGKLAPGEQGVIRLVAAVDRHALASEYNIPVLIRAKGDSDANDNTIYTYRSSATLEVTSSSTNRFVVAGLVLVLLLAAGFVWRKIR